VKIQECLRLLISQRDRKLKREQTGVFFWASPDIDVAFFNMCLAQTEWKKCDIPICASAKTFYNVVVHEPCKRASIVKREAE
jgi:hypothetical protein